MKVDVKALVDTMSRNHVNQSQLAKGAGITNRTVSDIVNGKSGARVETINKMAVFLGCAPSDLCMEVVR